MEIVKGILIGALLIFVFVFGLNFGMFLMDIMRDLRIALTNKIRRRLHPGEENSKWR